MAAIYVSDAQYNRNIFFDTSPEAVRLYLRYNHWVPQVLLYFFILLDLSLAVFEDPAVFPLPTWATMLVELLCLLVFTIRIVHYAKLTLVDMIIYGALKATNYYGVRWSRVLRPLLLVNVTEGRQLAGRSEASGTLCLRSSTSSCSSCSASSSSPSWRSNCSANGLTTIDGSPYFTNYLEIIFDLYVLVTTANSPDIMMPAYNASYYFAIFFILYILINNYIFMSVFLAVEEVRQLVRAKRHKMVRAFAVLQDQREGREPVVNQANWNQLVRLVQPDVSNAHRELLWSVCDNNNQGYIGKVAFVQLADLLNIEVITLKSRPHPLQSLCPSLYQSAPSRLLCKLAFVIVYDLIILVNAVFIGLDEKNPLIANSEWAFLALYLLEILLKLYVFEPRAFFSKHSFWNWFDTIIVISALIATIINSSILDIVFILRVLRLIRVVDSIKRFRTIINTLIRIGPAILTFGQLILVVYYVFAMVGMELFKHKVKFYEDSSDPAKAYCGNVLLKGTAFAQLNYCKNNFNNVVSSFILLVELTVVNHSGFAAVTHGSAKLFFVFFHIIVVIVIINIFVAFVLEAFFVEYSVDKSDLQTSLEKKIEELELAVAQETLEDNLVNAMETIDSDQGTGQSANNKPSLMFKIASKRYRTVDALLQRMFESDLDPEDFAENDDQNGNFANPAFSAA
ncbi:hypothetical protein F7725_005979 [Dissostichus mawsoni]|uniref:Ion transport domain-containing protein n=1 Tax=Dissostichus mawsoni TaxID=36200 RepID=A0A7J5YSS4_DISMA|nr:hypothetical protein F7725_005979 [Dissostichus mawsoni]